MTTDRVLYLAGDKIAGLRLYADDGSDAAGCTLTDVDHAARCLDSFDGLVVCERSSVFHHLPGNGSYQISYRPDTHPDEWWEALRARAEAQP